jgi:outer membrane protein OmpA-like peptidoglycan-associated protein
MTVSQDQARQGARRLRQVLSALIAALFAFMLVACSQPADDGDNCSALFSAPVGDGPHMVLMVDRTASSQRLALPPAVTEALTHAAQASGRVSLLAADGPGAPAHWVLQNAALNDGSLDADTRRHARIAELAAGCVDASVQQVTPTREGSDLLAGLQQVADAVHDDPTAQVVVLTDGLANAGGLDLDLLAVGDVAATDVVTGLQDGGLLPHLAGQSVTFSGIGQLAGEQPAQPARDWLRQLYAELCTRSGGGSCTVDVADAPVQHDDTSVPLPADPPVVLPGVRAVSMPGSCELTVSSALLFDPDSAQLRSGATGELAPLADLLVRTGGRATVVGHTSSAGDADGQRNTSEQRASAVAGLLAELGVSPSALAATGVGAADPVAADRSPDGSLLEPQAAQNRRVVVRATGVPGCPA